MGPLVTISDLSQFSAEELKDLRQLQPIVKLNQRLMDWSHCSLSCVLIDTLSSVVWVVSILIVVVPCAMLTTEFLHCVGDWLEGKYGWKSDGASTGTAMSSDVGNVEPKGVEKAHFSQDVDSEVNFGEV
jgi:hypothetical protein